MSSCLFLIPAVLLPLNSAPVLPLLLYINAIISGRSTLTSHLPALGVNTTEEQNKEQRLVGPRKDKRCSCRSGGGDGSRSRVLAPRDQGRGSQEGLFTLRSWGSRLLQDERCLPSKKGSPQSAQDSQKLQSGQQGQAQVPKPASSH